MNTRISTTFMITAISALLFATSAQAQECGNAAKMNFKAQENHISLDETAPLCVAVNGNGQIDAVFRIRIIGNPNFNAGTISVYEKNPGSGVTIRRNFDNTSELEIEVKGTPGNQTWFEYWIRAENVGQLDPKVRVVGTPPLKQHQAEVLKETLDANGISLEEVTELLRTIKP